VTRPTLRLSAGSVVRAVVIVGVFVGVAGVVVRAAHPIVWFVEASVIAALAWPAVQRLSRHMPAWLAVLGLTAAAAVVVGAIGAAGFTELQNEATRFRDTVPAAARRLEESRPFGGVLSDLHLGRQVERIGREAADRFELGGDLPGLASAVGGGVSAVFVVWVLSVMLVFTGPGMVDSTISALPAAVRERLGGALRQSYGVVLRHLGFTSIRAVVVGAVVYGAATGLHVDMPALLAAMAALAAFIPYVGIGLGALPLALLALLNSPQQSLAILAVAVAAQVLDSLVVQPRLDRATFSFGMFPTLVVVMVGVSLYGVVGLFVGLTLGAVAVAVLQNLDADQARWDRRSRDATSSSTEPGDEPDAMASSTDSSSPSTSDT
jgi:predicted PurR-regulated permease PerM